MTGAKAVILSGVSKRFGDVEAVRPLSLRVRAGEFLTLLGPSGCGKSTMLRMIAGLEQASSGTIMVGGEDVTGLPPNKRDTSIMFQDYALFPHKTLVENVAYGLKMRGTGRRERERRAEEWLERIGLPGYGRRLPHQLSGGQRQRVALARSLIISPGVLLLDEPLGALDASLRKQMRQELRRLHRDVGLTFVYVTHDQEEALAMSDRVAVMRAGAIEQLGEPKEIYDAPETEFVARFIGSCNVLTAKVVEIGRNSLICEAAGFAPLRVRVREGECHAVGARVSLALRPERITVERHAGDSGPKLNGAILPVSEVEFSGSAVKIRAAVAGGELMEAMLTRDSDDDGSVPSPGDSVVVRWRESALSVLRAQGEAAG